MSTCKKHTLPPAVPSLSVRHLGFRRHFPMPLICLSFSLLPALVARDPLKCSQTLLMRLCKWVVQTVLKNSRKRLAMLPGYQMDFVLLLKAIRHQDVDLHETSISTFQWCWNDCLSSKELLRLKKKKLLNQTELRTTSPQKGV